MDIKNLMEQAKQLQAKVSAAQDMLGESHVKGIAGGGMAIVEITCKYDPVKVTLSPEFMKEDAATASDLVLAAMNDAKAKADVMIDKVMGEATAGMPLPE